MRAPLKQILMMAYFPPLFPSTLSVEIIQLPRLVLCLFAFIFFLSLDFSISSLATHFSPYPSLDCLPSTSTSLPFNLFSPFAVNTLGLYFTSTVFLPLLRKAAEYRKSNQIPNELPYIPQVIVISSNAAWSKLPIVNALYNLSKVSNF